MNLFVIQFMQIDSNGTTQFNGNFFVAVQFLISCDVTPVIMPILRPVHIAIKRAFLIVAMNHIGNVEFCL